MAGCGTYYAERPGEHGVARYFADYRDFGYGYRDENVRKGSVDGRTGGAGNTVAVGRTVTADPVPGVWFSVGGPEGYVAHGPASASAPAREVADGVNTAIRTRGVLGAVEAITEETGDTLRAGIDAAR